MGEAEVRCPNCDYLNEANANYCSRCGEPMGTVEAEATATFTPIEAEMGDEGSRHPAASQLEEVR